MSVDLTTEYLGLRLRSPLVVAASPLSSELDVLQQLEESGAAAAVLPSLFEEQVSHKEPEARQIGQYGELAESLFYFRELQTYNRGPDAYFRYLERAKKTVSIPLMASLNATTSGSWLQVAKSLEQAGADALELNIYFIATDPQVTAAEVEQRYLDIVTSARDAVSIPLAVKVGPYFTAFANFAHRVVAAGADGLVLFNRYLHPDIQLDALKVTPRLALSSSDELRMPLRWIAILRSQLSVSLAATSGIHSPEDVIKAILAGANVAMVASVLYQHGAGHLRVLHQGTIEWLEKAGWKSIAQIRGKLSHAQCPDPAAFERANYTKAVSGFREVMH